MEGARLTVNATASSLTRQEKVKKYQFKMSLFPIFLFLSR